MRLNRGRVRRTVQVMSASGELCHWRARQQNPEAAQLRQSCWFETSRVCWREVEYW